MLDNPRTAVYNKDKERRWLHSGQLPLSVSHLRNMTAGVWKTIGAVIFLAILFFDIVFCVMHIPKKDLGNRPSDFGSAKDDSGQKAEQSNNSIQNFHSGILP